MLQLSTVGELRQLDVKSISLSETRAQIERRNQFDKKALDELAENIKHQGVVVPIIVRPTKPFEIVQDSAPNTSWSIWRQEGTRKTHGDPVVGRFDSRDEAEAKLLELVADSDHFELIAGERRLLAARKAGLSSIPAIVRNVTASQAHEIQLIENLQREDLHELAEAEGYEALLKRGMSADEIADKMAKSKSHVYARMKLIALSEKCRAAFYEGKINASVALLLARVPVHELQDKAIDKILKPHEFARDPMTYRDAQRYMQDEFTLKLSQAPFPKDDETLVPGAGTCAACPKRTGNQPADLFGDIKSADVCTDPVCFKEKRTAHMKRELEKAKSTGSKVLTGSKAAAVLPGRYAYGEERQQLRNGYVRPNQKCATDPKKRTYAELAGKDAAVTLIQDPKTGRTSRAFAIADIKEKLKASGVTLKEPSKSDGGSRTNVDYEAQRKAREAEGETRQAVVIEVIKKASSTFGRAQKVELIAAALDKHDTNNLPDLIGVKLRRHSWGSDRVKAIAEAITKCSDTDLNRLANVAAVLEDLGDTYGDWKRVVAAAKRVGVDAQKIRDEIEAAKAPPVAAKDEKPPVAAKGKKAKKAKPAKKK